MPLRGSAECLVINIDRLACSNDSYKEIVKVNGSEHWQVAFTYSSNGKGPTRDLLLSFKMKGKALLSPNILKHTESIWLCSASRSPVSDAGGRGGYRDMLEAWWLKNESSRINSTAGLQEHGDFWTWLKKKMTRETRAQASQQVFRLSVLRA